MENVVEFIKENRIGKYMENVSLSNYTSYRVGGCSRLMVLPKNAYKLSLLLKFLKENKVPYLLLGNGSNVLFSDQPYEGVILKLDAFDQLIIEDTMLTVGAGYPLQKLALQVARKGLSGLEFAAGIPGTVGGAVYMNAGAYQSDMGYLVSKIKVMDQNGVVKTLYNRELDFHYRSSLLQRRKDLICLEATLVLKHGKKKEILEIMEDRKQRRLLSQPLEYPSAGSVFRNPLNQYAGKLIEDLHLKGKRIGGAMVSEKHANFIINENHATAKDIKDLTELIQKEVKEHYQIDLKVEQEYMNW